MTYSIKIVECPACMARQSLKIMPKGALYSECHICAGTGIVVIPENGVLCAACRGTGLRDLGSGSENSNVICKECRGFGVVIF